MKLANDTIAFNKLSSRANGNDASIWHTVLFLTALTGQYLVHYFSSLLRRLEHRRFADSAPAVVNGKA
jgi:hypothetical protein